MTWTLAGRRTSRWNSPATGNPCPPTVPPSSQPPLEPATRCSSRGPPKVSWTGDYY